MPPPPPNADLPATKGKLGLASDPFIAREEDNRSSVELHFSSRTFELADRLTASYRAGYAPRHNYTCY